MTESFPSKLGPYEVRLKLGSGGMGEVYLAEDARLKRQVAIKVIAPDSHGDEQANRRLVREAQAIAALDHPNICSIYEVGEQDGRTFIVMQHVEGETLSARIRRAPLTVSEVLNIAIPVADGLAEAHARGIVHRDIKPQNIMLTPRGQAKILDFGLAKATTDDNVASVETRSLLTQAGTIVGTAPYMSPEQVKGEALDARSDIFSFGAVVYELLTTKCLFGAPTAAETVSAILTSDPPSLASHGVQSPMDLERVVRQCLHRNREQRYQSMREVRLELEAVRRALESGTASVAPVDVPKETLERAGRRLTMRAALAVGIGLLAVAAAAYSRYATVSPAPNASQSAIAFNSPAYDLYLRGKVNVSSENPENNETAIRLLGQAVAADPAFAPAHADLARALNIKAFYFAPDSQRDRLYEDAQVSLEKALRLDPTLSEAHLARGLLLWTHANRFPHDQAVQSYKRAIQLNPKLDEGHHQLAMVYLHVGMLDKAWAELEQALAINPANTLARFRYGVIDLYRGRYESALAIFNSTPLDKNPSLLTYQKAMALFQLGRIQEARAIVEEYLANNSTDEGGTMMSVKALLHAKAGEAQEAERSIQRAIQTGKTFGHFHHTAYNIASVYALLNKPNEAMQWLQTAADDGFPCYPLFLGDANLDNLRSDKRFAAFLAEMKARLQAYEKTL